MHVYYYKGDISKVTSLEKIFETTSHLIRKYKFNQDLGNWNTSNVITMAQMFDYNNDFNQDLSKWQTGKVTSMFQMFNYATAFNGDVSKWNTSRVTNMGSMFNEAEAFNSDISKCKFFILRVLKN